MEKSGITVQLGPREYRVVPQKLGRIERKLRVIFAVFGTGDAESAVEVDPGILYEALAVFIPDIDEEWAFRGFASQEAFENFSTAKAGEDVDKFYADADADRSPDVPQIIEAVEAIYKVNGGDRLVRFFGKLVRPEAMSRMIEVTMGEWAARGLPEKTTSTSDPSPNSPPTNGGSPPTTSMTRVPISPGVTPPVDGPIQPDPAGPPRG